MFGKIARFSVRQFSQSSRRPKRLDDYVAVLTGSTSGIGLDTARRLGQEGAKIVISSRKTKNVTEAVEELKNDHGVEAEGLTCDAGNLEELKSMFAHVGKNYGGIDILFQNAGLNTYVGPILKTPEKNIDEIMKFNLKVNFNACREVIQYMKGRKNPSIVLHSSCASYLAEVYPSVYTISKGTLFTLTRSLVWDLSRYGIRINCVAPTSINTKFGAAIVENPVYTAPILKRMPMNCLGEKEDVSGFVAFLVSPGASYVTGEIYPIAGAGHARC